MTPDEQDVYAWMGISPIVLTTQELKNPKSANIFVMLPGQAPPLTPVEATETPKVEDESAPDMEDSPPPIPEPIALRVRKKPSARVIAEPEPLLTSNFTVAEVPSEPDLDEQPAPEPEEEATVTRRRRRRSSATAGE
jgi:ribonuclease E